MTELHEGNIIFEIADRLYHPADRIERLARKAIDVESIEEREKYLREYSKAIEELNSTVPLEISPDKV